jgi:hypothetical protein
MVLLAFNFTVKPGHWSMFFVCHSQAVFSKSSGDILIEGLAIMVLVEDKESLLMISLESVRAEESLFPQLQVIAASKVKMK